MTVMPISLRKMRSEWYAQTPVQYSLISQGSAFSVNDALGKTTRIAFTGIIKCIACDRVIKKSYQQGYCFPCTQKLAQCDLCIVKPELCHFHKGTCREPEWGQAHCMIPHTLYAAVSSGLKVGITRSHQQVTRWIDQGATQALPIARVKKRLDAGMLEVMLKQDFADKTNWRAMLKGPAEPMDLEEVRDEILGLLPTTVDYEVCEEDPLTIEYPIVSYPRNIKSHSLDKTPVLEGTLLGIKSQYLLFESCVINLRAHAGYQVEWSH